MRRIDGFMQRKFHIAISLLAVLAGLLAMLAPTGAAETKALPRSHAEVQLSFAPLVKQVAPAVVNIYTRRVVQQVTPSPLQDDPFLRRFFGDGQLFGQRRERVQRSLGSGVILDPHGLIVTNNHVIDGAQEITVSLADRREFEAEVALADPRTDLAVLRIKAGKEPLPTLELRDSDELEVGDLVLAIGNPFGVGQTVTSGIVSALGRTIVGQSDTQSFIQTDAAINPGNSGGALVTMDGRLAGINTAIFSRSGGSLGIGFAIPANLVASVLHSAMAGHGVIRPWLGAGGQAVTAELAAGLGLDRPGGVVISKIFPDSPADQAGLKVGDVVLAVDGREIFDPRGLKFRIATRNVGEQATLDVVRAGVTRHLTVALLPPPDVPARDITPLDGAHPLAGATVANLSPAYAEELGLDNSMTGVIITEIASGSTAQRIHLRPGDVLLSLNGSEVTSVKQLQKQLRSRSRNWQLSISRGGRVLKLEIRG